MTRYGNPRTSAISPYTGLERKDWIAIAESLLAGVFSHVDAFDDPIVFPRLSEKSYPQDPDDAESVKSNEFEGLARSFFIAAPLIQENPNLKIADMSLKDYYLNQLLLATDPKSERFFGFLNSFGRTDQSLPLACVVQGGGLAVGLLQCLDNFWGDYSKQEQDQIAQCLQNWSSGMTYGHNWRFFSVMMSTFLLNHDYSVDMDIYYDHLHNISAWYTGDGWYRDGRLFNYYCPWAFHFYGPIWCKWWGYEHAPALARLFEERHRLFQETYPRFFGKNGESLLWGRSINYRFAASSALPMSFFLNNGDMSKAGEYRRICSGNILQFVNRDDVFTDGIPNLGYYRACDDLIQDYACAASPFWCAKTFHALSLPEDHPFWTQPETDSIWTEDQVSDRVHKTFLQGPGLLVSNHLDSGYTELRTCKVDSKAEWDSKLVFNTHFQSDMCSQTGASGMQYSFTELRNPQQAKTPSEIKLHKYHNGVLYRQLFLDVIDYESRIDLAEIVLPFGTLRVDRVRLNAVHDVYLGHYALPQGAKAGESAFSRVETPAGSGYQGSYQQQHVALINLSGWDAVALQKNSQLNPEYEDSELPYCVYTPKKMYGGMKILACLMLNKVSADPWRSDELDVVEEFKLIDITQTGDVCAAAIKLRSGECYLIDFSCIEGSFTI